MSQKANKLARLLAVMVAGLTSSPAPASETGIDLTVATHVALSDYGPGLGASFDLVLAGAWVPIPELAVGLEGAIAVPLPTGDTTAETDIALRANPAIWLRLGDPSTWGYLKLGCGVDSHLREGDLEPVMVVLGAAGFAVAPRTLLFYFGFELSGKIEVVGSMPTRAIGLGGFMGFSF